MCAGPAIVAGPVTVYVKSETNQGPRAFKKKRFHKKRASQVKAREAVPANRVTKHDIILSSGEVFPDGTLIELVSESSDSGRLNLLLCNGARSHVAAEIEYAGRTYAPIFLEPSVANAIAWPQCLCDYGSTRELFDRILALITTHFGFPEPFARLLVYFVFSTWFSDRLTVVPTLAIASRTTADGIRLLRFLRCACRRSLLLADVSRTDLLSLPLLLSPTLLLDRPKLTNSLQRFLASSNRRGVAAIRKGKVLQVACPKALHFGRVEVPQGIGSGVIRIGLPECPQVVELSDRALHDIAVELQGKLLAYRCSNLTKIRVCRLRGTDFTRETEELAMNLASCVVSDADLASGLTPLMLEQDERFRQEVEYQFETAIIEALLACCHEMEKDRVQVKEIASLANTILSSRGESVAYNPEEVAHRLDAFELPRTRSSTGSFLVLSSMTRQTVHRLACLYRVPSIQSLRAGCAECENLRPGDSRAM